MPLPCSCPSHPDSGDGVLSGRRNARQGAVPAGRAAVGATALRTGIAAVVLAIVWAGRGGCASQDIEAAGLNHLRDRARLYEPLLYLALDTIPLGIAVAIEFTGPLAVAVAASRRTLDFVWIASCGSRPAGPVAAEPRSPTARAAGRGLALVAGACWALYIIYGRRAGSVHGGASTALGMLISSLFVVPLGTCQEWIRAVVTNGFMTGTAVAIVSSALPYSLEMIAMPKLPTRVLGVLLSLDPVLGALAGFMLLNEHLTGPAVGRNCLHHDCLGRQHVQPPGGSADELSRF